MVHNRWDPRVFHGSNVITTLKNAEELFRAFGALGTNWGTLGNVVNLGRVCCEHVSSIHVYYSRTYVHTKEHLITFFNDAIFFEKTSIIRHLRPKGHVAKNTTFG